MTEKRLAENPLLYIHQPMIKQPEAPMQSNYRTPKGSVESTKEQVVHYKEAKDTHKVNEEAKFNEMSLKEQVNYLANKPEQMPSIRCVLKTTERTYEGVITEFKEDAVYFRVGRRASSIRIRLEEIESVRLLGF